MVLRSSHWDTSVDQLVTFLSLHSTNVLNDLQYNIWYYNTLIGTRRKINSQFLQVALIKFPSMHDEGDHRLVVEICINYKPKTLQHFLKLYFRLIKNRRSFTSLSVSISFQ